MSGLSKVSSILGASTTSNKEIDRSGLSGLNKYLGERGYNVITKKQMVEIAQALGLNHIKSVDDVQDTKEGRVNKNLILEALKKARFAKGGVVGLDQNVIRGLGEHGIALVRNEDVFLNREDAKIIKELVGNIKPLGNLVKLTKPNIENITNNNTNPIIQFNLTGGTITSDAMPQFNKWKKEIISDIGDILYNGKRKN